jgi:3-dehydroquinate dehydratase/shikimate dehydrogenase
VAPGVFDLEARLSSLPDGEAFQWVGWAERLGDSGRLRRPLAWARDHGIRLSAFLLGPKGLPSLAMQAAWGGAFTYAAPDDGPPAAPGQLPLSTLRAWRAAKLHSGYGLCGVIGDPVLHSRSPSFHNARLHYALKDLIYLPLLCADADEAMEAMETLGILGLSLTAPLQLSLPEALGLKGPLNTLWRRKPGDSWRGANTDAEAFEQSLSSLEPGPVLLLGEGGVARTSRAVLDETGWTVLQASGRFPATTEAVSALGPVGIVQATNLGMSATDSVPFLELLEAARSSARWAVEWDYQEDTAFACWAKEAGLRMVGGGTLFDAQAEAQSRRFIEGCGGVN